MSKRKSSLSAGQLTLYDCQKKNRTVEESSCNNADTVEDITEIEPVDTSLMCTSHASINEIEVSEVLCEDGKYSQRSLHCWAKVLAMTSTLVSCVIIGPEYDQLAIPCNGPAYIRR